MDPKVAKLRDQAIGKLKEHVVALKELRATVKRRLEGLNKEREHLAVDFATGISRIHNVDEDAAPDDDMMLEYFHFLDQESILEQFDTLLDEATDGIEETNALVNDESDNWFVEDDDDSE